MIDRSLASTPCSNISRAISCVRESGGGGVGVAVGRGVGVGVGAGVEVGSGVGVGVGVGVIVGRAVGEGRVVCCGTPVAVSAGFVTRFSSSSPFDRMTAIITAITAMPPTARMAMRKELFN